VPVIKMAESSNTVLLLEDDPDYFYGATILEADDFGIAVGLDGRGASISTVIPGLNGPVVVGAGALNSLGNGGTAELEINLLNEAQQEGASLNNKIRLNVYALDSDGNQVSVWVEYDVDPGGDINDATEMPGVPGVGLWEDKLGGVLGGALWNLLDDYPFTAAFDDTLAVALDDGSGGRLPAGGMYEITIVDSFQGVWNVIVMASEAGGGLVTLPSLIDAPGSLLAANVPLATNNGVKWRSSVAAYNMGETFPERGFFFDAVKRDRLSWSKSFEPLLEVARF
jgi:hypothetical protein